MKKSKHTKVLKILPNVYAVFNNLLLEPVFLTKKELMLFRWNKNFQNSAEFKNRGIFINNKDADRIAEQKLKDYYFSNTRIPTFAYFLITDCCNLRCKYCFIENNACASAKTYNMTFDTAKTAIEKIDSFCQANNLATFEIIFYGGEPLIGLNLIDKICDYAKIQKTKFVFSMITNGTLLNKEAIKILEKHHIGLGISIDGPKQINDENRIYGTNSNVSVYDSVICAIELLQKSKIDFSLSVTISDAVLNDQDMVLEWLKKINLPLSFNLMHLCDCKNWKKFYKRSSEFIHKAYECLEKNNILEDRVQRNIVAFENSNFKIGDCGAVGARQLTILPSGKVVVCHGDAKSNKNVIGDILSDSIEKMLKHETIQKFVDFSPVLKKKCLKCEGVYICGGGCYYECNNVFKGKYFIDKPFCIYTKDSLKFILRRCYKNLKGGG